MSGLIYAVLWVCCRIVAKVCLRYHVSGTEHIPRHGGVLFAANHASYVDIPLLGCAIPRRVYFLGRANLFPHPWLKKALRALGWIPLRTDRLDRYALDEAVSKIKAGYPVVIFPEGTRTPHGQLQPGKPGIGLIVAKAQCPVIPAYIAGSYHVWPAGKTRLRCHPVAVRFGPPVEFTVDGARVAGKDFYCRVSTTIMNRIAELGQVPPPERMKTSPGVSRSTASRVNQ